MYDNCFDSPAARELMKDFPNLNTILDGTAPDKEMSTSVQYAACSLLCYELTKTSRDDVAFLSNVDNTMGFAIRNFHFEIMVMMVRDINRHFNITDEEFTAMNSFKDFSKKYTKLTLAGLLS